MQQVTIVNPNPGGVVVTLDGQALPAIEGSNGGTTYHAHTAGFAARNTLVAQYGMARTWQYELAVPDDADGLQLFLFLGLAVLVDLGIGAIVAQVPGKPVGG